MITIHDHDKLYILFKFDPFENSVNPTAYAFFVWSSLATHKLTHTTIDHNNIYF